MQQIVGKFHEKQYTYMPLIWIVWFFCAFFHFISPAKWYTGAYGINEWNIYIWKNYIFKWHALPQSANFLSFICDILFFMEGKTFNLLI